MEMTPDLTKGILEFWQPFYGHDRLTVKDAIEIYETVGSVFALLNQWKYKEETQQEDHNHAERKRFACLS